MKFLIASDIHGSYLSARRLIEAFEREGCSRLILLGDILYHGPRNALPDEYAPMKVAEALNAMKDSILCVRGNCDAEIDDMVLGFPVMADYALMPVGERLMFITHGHLYNLDKLPPLKKGDILLHGHTHVPVCAEGDVIYMNPGSAAIPKDEHGKTYMTMENGIFSWKTLDGEEFMTFIA